MVARMRRPITYTSVKNPRWINRHQIHCFVQFDHLGVEEVPFVADAYDIEPHRREIFQRAAKGEFGGVGTVLTEEIERWPKATFEPLPKWPEIQHILAKANLENASQTDTGTVILWTAVLHELLSKALLSYGVKVPQKFASCINEAHRIGLITDAEKRAFHLAREVRNRFGHQSLASFDEGDTGSKTQEFYDIVCGDQWQAPAIKMLFSGAAAALATKLYALL